MRSGMERVTLFKGEAPGGLIKLHTQCVYSTNWIQ